MKALVDLALLELAAEALDPHGVHPMRIIDARHQLAAAIREARERPHACEEECRACSFVPPHEGLWDAFEEVERLAASVAFGGGYVPVPDRNALQKAIMRYRAERDNAATNPPRGEGGT